MLDNKEALHTIEDRLHKAVDYVLESNTKLRSSERKLMRNKLTQLTSCLTLKVPPAANTAQPRPRPACSLGRHPSRLHPRSTAALPCCAAVVSIHHDTMGRQVWVDDDGVWGKM